MDRHTKEQRSFNMSQVRSKNTRPEKLVFRELKKEGLKFHKHYKILGKPDVVFLKERLVVFIDGEFWHGKNFNKWSGSLSNFWIKKINNNIKRDRRIRRQLKKNGWKVLRLWDKKIIKHTKKEVNKIIKKLN
jgi:DNA mismatch endonuclease, patch repair protein